VRIEEIGNTVYTEGICHGVNDGPLHTPHGEVPPAGKEVAFRFAVVVTGDPTPASPARCTCTSTSSSSSPSWA
jgi:hypothetical protein